MRTKHLLSVSFMLCLAVMLVLPARAQAPKSSGQAAPKVLRWAYSMPSKKSQSYGWEWFGPEFEKRTNGRYKVEFYPGETLFKMVAAYDSVASNVAQIANVSVGQLEKRLPLSNGCILPTVDFPPSLQGRMDAGRAFMELYRKLPQLQAEWKGVKVIGYHQLNPYVLISKKKEIYLPEHFKGLKVGGSGARMKLVSNNGGADVNQLPPDTYMNMDKGVVDAAFVSWSMIWDYKLWEAAKYIFDFGFGGGGFGIIMNNDAWNQMSAEDQKTFMDVWSRAYEIASQNVYSEVEKGMQAAANGGARIRKPTDQETAAWRKAAAPVIEEWIKDTKKLGAKDPELVLAEWQKLARHKD